MGLQINIKSGTRESINSKTRDYHPHVMTQQAIKDYEKLKDCNGKFTKTTNSTDYISTLYHLFNADGRKDVHFKFYHNGSGMSTLDKLFEKFNTGFKLMDDYIEKILNLKEQLEFKDDLTLEDLKITYNYTQKRATIPEDSKLVLRINDDLLYLNGDNDFIETSNVERLEKNILVDSSIVKRVLKFDNRSLHIIGVDQNDYVRFYLNRKGNKNVILRRVHLNDDKESESFNSKILRYIHSKIN